MSVAAVKTAVEAHATVQRVLDDDHAAGRARPVERLPLTVVLHHCMRRHTMHTVGQLGQLSLASVRGRLIEYPASAGARAGMSPLPGGRQHCVIPCGM